MALCCDTRTEASLKSGGGPMRNRFHALCPYFAMFPEAFAKKWIMRLTKPGDTVLDPFSGRGTTALTALLSGRNAVACDVNDVAYCLTRAKTSPPSIRRLTARIKELSNGYEPAIWVDEAAEASEFFKCCFAPNTLAQLLYLRSALGWRIGKADAMIAGLVLGSLHGDSGPSSPYFSNQMPRTISTKPAYSVRFWKERNLEPPERNVFTMLTARALFRYESEIPRGHSVILNTDMRCLPLYRSKWGKISCVITSPPYLNVTSFEEDQWLRLWFLGGPSHPTRNRLSIDDRHLRPDVYWQFIGDMWRSLAGTVAEHGHVIVRIGSRSMDVKQMRSLLTVCSSTSHRKVSLISSRVTNLRKRQTDAFRPGTSGCKVELDCHFQFNN